MYICICCISISSKCMYTHKYNKEVKEYTISKREKQSSYASS